MKSNMVWKWYFKLGRFTIGWLRATKVVNKRVIKVQPIKWEVRDNPDSNVRVYQMGRFEIIREL